MHKGKMASKREMEVTTQKKFTPLDNSQNTDIEYSFPHMARHHFFFPLLTVRGRRTT